MKEKHNKIDRRGFLKTMGAAGMGSVFASAGVQADPNEPKAPEKPQESRLPQVPKRKLGKTGVEVPCLSLGGTINLLENQIMLKKALEWGVTYWDTSDSYEGGNSELGIGNYLSKNPDMREKLFIVTKAYGTKTIEDTEVHLQESIKKMATKYVDLYFIMEREKDEHGLSDPSQLTDRLKRWVKLKKKWKQIRFFGFSTHKNMAQCLTRSSGRHRFIKPISASCGSTSLRVVSSRSQARSRCRSSPRAKSRAASTSMASSSVMVGFNDTLFLRINQSAKPTSTARQGQHKLTHAGESPRADSNIGGFAQRSIQASRVPAPEAEVTAVIRP